MIYKKNIINNLKVFVWLSIFLLQPVYLMAQEDGAKLLNTFRNQDKKQLLPEKSSKQNGVTGFTASFTIATQHPFDAAQGMEVKNCTISWTDDSRIISCESTYEHPPVYRPSGVLDYRPLDYDKEGNLIIWRSQEKYVFSTKDRNEAIEKLVMYKISPEGNVKASDIYTQLYRYPLGSAKSTYLFDQFRMATGRGFGKHLIKITTDKAKVNSSGLYVLDAIGTYGPSLKGRWVASYEQNADYIIRKGSFYVNGSNSPLVSVSNSGLVECPGLKIAKFGKFSVERYEAQFQVLSLKKSNFSDAEVNPLYKEVLNRVTTPLLPGESEIIDYRGTKPTRIREE